MKRKFESGQSVYLKYDETKAKKVVEGYEPNESGMVMNAITPSKIPPQKEEDYYDVRCFWYEDGKRMDALFDEDSLEATVID